MIFCGDVSATQITSEYFETCNAEALFADVLGEFSYHGTYCKKLAAFYLAVSELDKEKTDAAYNNLIDWLSKTEEVIGQFFDFYIFKVRKLDVVMRNIKNIAN